MTMSDFYEQRQRQKAQDRADTREDKRLEAEIKRQADADKAEREQQREAARAEQERRDRREAEQRKKREKAERAQRRADQLGLAKAWLAAEADTAFSVALIILAVVPAIISQVGALSGKTDPGSATSLALMLELGAWSATVGATRAMKDGRPVTPYRVAMWGCAAIAAAINVAHNGGVHDWFGWVMGAASLAGVAFWELRCVGRHGTSRRTKAERKEARKRRLHQKERKRLHPEIWHTAAGILADAEYGSITQEQAWTLAREIHRGTNEAGLTPALVALREASRKQMEKARGTVAAAAEADPLFPDTVPDELLREFRGTFGTVYRSPLGSDADGDEGPSDGPLNTAPKAPSGGPSDTAGALGGKEKQATRGGRRERLPKPLDPEHLEQVRYEAMKLGTQKKTISNRIVRKLIGGGENEYIARLTRTVKGERGEQ
ncbi:hypothetical protein ACGF07_31815 [Kitasatospora sp. NPDC048194]|uniref:hypothetical protein n=1 Tax=Kitasatospora sp. NPDC048194 TaxID=3364045 RepID=UPI003718685E